MFTSQFNDLIKQQFRSDEVQSFSTGKSLYTDVNMDLSTANAIILFLATVIGCIIINASIQLLDGTFDVSS